MSISLVIPTYNRALLLQDALESVAASDVNNTDKIEVIVVDNNSGDDTPSVVKQFRWKGFPFELRYCLERKRGLSAARNRGIAESSADYIVFMDDDQRIEANYLARVERIFQQTQAGVIGGPVEYWNLDRIPVWSRELIANIGQFHAGSETRALTPDERMLNGGNMAIVRDVIQKVGGFDETLGRSGDSALANEDREIQERFHAAGYRIFYTPELLQYHYLQPARLTKRYWRKNRFDWGRTLYRHHHLSAQQETGATLLGAPRWFWSSLAIRELPRYLRSLISASPEQKFDRQLEIFVMLGRIYEARRSLHAPNRKAQ